MFDDIGDAVNKAKDVISDITAEDIKNAANTVKDHVIAGAKTIKAGVDNVDLDGVKNTISDGAGHVGDFGKGVINHMSGDAARMSSVGFTAVVVAAAFVAFIFARV